MKKEKLNKVIPLKDRTKSEVVVELPVSQENGGQVEKTFNELRKLFMAYEWLGNNVLSGTFNNPELAEEKKQKIIGIISRFSG